MGYRKTQNIIYRDKEKYLIEVSNMCANGVQMNKSRPALPYFAI